MSFTTNEIKEAYIKLKSYVYYDNTDLLLRRQLVEFETNIGKDFLKRNPDSYYNAGVDFFSNSVRFTLEEKFERIAAELNNFHEDPTFFNAIFDDIDVSFYPKKFEKIPEEPNFISNKKVRNNYNVERVTPFIYAPIEIHIISVLWILNHGINKDAALQPECLGNRLLLNNDKSGIVQGSGLFKPYFRQYQKWRDEAVEVAVELLKKGKNISFLNLDIKDYFSSVRLNRSDLFSGRKQPAQALASYYNLQEVFLTVHDIYSTLLAKQYKSPHNFYKELTNENGNLNKVVLPIGLVSSYVLANQYLQDFDAKVTSIVKPAFYGRYVDDMLFVIIDPVDVQEKGSNESRNSILNTVVAKTAIEKFVGNIFGQVIELVQCPFSHELRDNVADWDNAFKLKGYDSLYCQSEKSLIHYFKSDESHMVIDKLKQELDERSSEFRDFPGEDESNISFTSSAYHLHYEGTEGKIRTLKDYKENRYGLTVFLANKIFSSLRHENHLSDKESEQIVNFFKGETCLSFYRLWERILTLFLVSQRPKHYVEFFLHCYEQIDRLQVKDEKTSVTKELLKNTLLEYLDASHELTLSLNLDFLTKTEQVARNLDFKLNEQKNNNWSNIYSKFEPTRPNSYWVRRFRRANMMRHHYVIHPLLTYSVASKKGGIGNLTSINLSFKDYKLDKELIEHSPRRVKFWECCMSEAYGSLNKQYSKRVSQSEGSVLTDIFCLTRKSKGKEDEFYLDDAFELYKQINRNHIPHYVLSEDGLKNRFFQRTSDTIKNSPPVNIQEISVNRNIPDSKKFKIAFCNTEVEEDNIIQSMRGTPNLKSERYEKLASIVNKVRLDKSDVLLFPEFFMPINLLSSIVKYSERNQVLTITGLEHVKIKDTVFNFIVTILPFEENGIKDAVVVFRLKNHYAHIEESLIRGNHLHAAKPTEYRYDLYNWRNLYFCPYYCFELANAWHRSIFKSKLDLLVGVEWNKDTNYFSNIIESCSRDLHCYVAQVNTSQYGDSRLTQPVESARMDVLRLKGGANDAILVAEVDLDKIREFQRKTFDLTHHRKEYKPLPPDYEAGNVLKRINNEQVL